MMRIGCCVSISISFGVCNFKITDCPSMVLTPQRCGVGVDEAAQSHRAAYPTLQRLPEAHAPGGG